MPQIEMSATGVLYYIEFGLDGQTMRFASPNGDEWVGVSRRPEPGDWRAFIEMYEGTGPGRTLPMRCATGFLYRFVEGDFATLAEFEDCIEMVKC